MVIQGDSISQLLFLLIKISGFKSIWRFDTSLLKTQLHTYVKLTSLPWLSIKKVLKETQNAFHAVYLVFYQKRHYILSYDWETISKKQFNFKLAFCRPDQGYQGAHWSSTMGVRHLSSLFVLTLTLTHTVCYNSFYKASKIRLMFSFDIFSYVNPNSTPFSTCSVRSKSDLYRLSIKKINDSTPSEHLHKLYEFSQIKPLFESGGAFFLGCKRGYVQFNPAWTLCLS